MDCSTSLFAPVVCWDTDVNCGNRRMAGRVSEEEMITTLLFLFGGIIFLLVLVSLFETWAEEIENEKDL